MDRLAGMVVFARVIDAGSFTAAAGHSGRLEAVLTEWTPPPSGIYAVYPHNRHLSAKVRAFVDFLVERLGSGQIWEPAPDGAQAR
jgi:DNA-binding transcriptional LysR family regulator